MRPTKTEVVIDTEQEPDENGRYHVTVGGYNEWWSAEKLVDAYRSGIYTFKEPTPCDASK